MRENDFVICNSYLSQLIVYYICLVIQIKLQKAFTSYNSYDIAPSVSGKYCIIPQYQLVWVPPAHISLKNGL